MAPGAPEVQARQEIDALLAAAGWFVCDSREFPLKRGHGHADYLL